jgi:hypothetical protein
MSGDEKRTRQKEVKPTEETRICSYCKGTGKKGERGRYGRAHLKDLEARVAKQRAEGKQDG